MGILRLGHVDVTVTDLDLATAYYTEVIGLLETERDDTFRLDTATGRHVLKVAESGITDEPAAWIDAAGDYMCVHADGQTHVLRATMKELEEMLDPQVFQRVHRSTIVNLARVRSLRPHLNGECFLKLQSGQEVKLSRSFRDKVELLLAQHRGLETRLQQVDLPAALVCPQVRRPYRQIQPLARVDRHLRPDRHRPRAVAVRDEIPLDLHVPQHLGQVALVRRQQRVEDLLALPVQPPAQGRQRLPARINTSTLRPIRAWQHALPSRGRAAPA